MTDTRPVVLKAEHLGITFGGLKAVDGVSFTVAKGEPLQANEQRSLLEMHRQWQQASVLPAELVQAKSLAGSRCEHAWRSQRPRGLCSALRCAARRPQRAWRARGALRLAAAASGRWATTSTC